MFEEFQLIIHGNPEMFGFLTFFLGAGFGHWLTLSRDKRKEFNDAALPIRTWLLNEVNEPSPYQKMPTKIEIDTFVSTLGFIKKALFLKAYEKQGLERKNAQFRDGFGQALYKDNTKIIQSLESCLKYTNRKELGISRSSATCEFLSFA